MESLGKKWDELKDLIYYWDGSWRDLYIRNTNKEDWEKWVNYVNQNYIINWYNGKTGIEENQINYDVIKGYLDGEHDLCSSAQIFIGKIQINCHFFSESEIENDIDPREINSVEDHEKILKHMTDLSIILDKEVIVTPEGEPEIILMNVKEQY
ncbi:MAG: hypothetical protein QM660_14700 [Dysgonomonas sp.]